MSTATRSWSRPGTTCPRATAGPTRASPCDETPLGRDFFGGDLAGVTAKLDDLSALGVTAIYFNPIFAAPSNHRYDTSSYDVVDPDLGTEADLARLIAEAKARDIRVILDGVFNHVSSDSPWFDREQRFEETGACEAADSAYRSWFTFRAPGPNEPSPCAPSTAGGDDTFYAGWFGFDTIPELVEQAATNDLFVGPDGVVGRWVEAGTAGWRLDVMDNMSHGLVRKVREATKAADSEALVLGEQWLDSSAWLLGDQADSTMNYRFRRAVIGLVNGDTADLDGAIVGLAPSQFASRMESVMEDYPKPAWDALLNLVDSHDTSRILWTLAPGEDDPAVKESPEGLAEAKAKLRLVAALQLTWPGMASIYYGTEAGLTGHDDPDDRRPYPWETIDIELRDWYRTLGRLRGEHEALRTGDLRFVHADDAAGTLAYVRRTDEEAAVVVLNLGEEERTVDVSLAGALPASAILADALGDASLTVGNAPISVTVPARGVAVLVTEPGTDLAGPDAPGGVSASGGGGPVEVGWDEVEGAAGYEVWRSIVPGGGYELVGKGTEPAFSDATVRPGTRYQYVVHAVDAAANLSPRSAEASALPELAVEDARLDEPAEVSQPLSAVDPGTPIRALVRADGTDASGPVVGIRAQLGVGPARGDPGTDYAWTEMAFDADVDGADRLVGAVRPEESGTFNVVLRVSTNDGRDWEYADRGGIVTVDDTPWGYRPDQSVTLATTPAADTQAPPAPSAPTVATVAGSSLTLAWEPVTAPDLYRYEVRRGTAPGGPFEEIGAAVEPRFTDDTIAAGATYVYVVVAVDTSFNRSAPSPETTTQAETREIAVTFTVSLPATTPPGDTIHIAGDFQGWDPAGTPMTKVDDVTWTITLALHGGRRSPVQVHAGLVGGGREGRRLRGDPQPHGARHVRRRTARSWSRTPSRSGATSTSAADPARRSRRGGPTSGASGRGTGRPALPRPGDDGHPPARVSSRPRGRPALRPPAAARRAPRRRPRRRGQAPARPRGARARWPGATSASSTCPDGPLVAGLGALGVASAATSPRRGPVSTPPTGPSTRVVGCWSWLRGVDPPALAEVDRVLRPGGRLLVVHDYGRDDVSACAGPDAPEYTTLEPPRRAVPARRVPDPRRPLLLDLRLDRRRPLAPPRRVRPGR